MDLNEADSELSKVLVHQIGHYVVIAREERYMETIFGAPYVEYWRRVRRWL